MSSQTANEPRGARPEVSKRVALDVEAIEQIRREQEKGKEREFVRFGFYQVDPSWRRLTPSDRAAHKEEFIDVIEKAGRRSMV